MGSQCFGKDAANPAVTDNNFLVLQTVIALSFRQRDQFSPRPPNVREVGGPAYETIQRENQWWRTTSELTAVRVKGPIATPAKRLPASGRKCLILGERARLETTGHRWTSTGTLQWVRTLTVSLPSTIAEIPWRPCEAITIRSQTFDAAVSMIAR